MKLLDSNRMETTGGGFSLFPGVSCEKQLVYAVLMYQLFGVDIRPLDCL